MVPAASSALARFLSMPLPFATITRKSDKGKEGGIVLKQSRLAPPRR